MMFRRHVALLQGDTVLTEGATCLQVANSSSVKLVSEVVEFTATMLANMGQLPNRTLKELPTIMVGSDDLQKQVVGHLTAAGSRRLVLLRGMGGIGKTTLAKAVFNELQGEYPTMRHHFLQLEAGVTDVMLKQRELLECLAREKEVQLHDADDGRRLLGEKLGGKKVLLVVDNVWGGQLGWLLPRNIMQVLEEGSMVLVTTQEQSVAFGDPGIDWVRVEMGCLSDADSMELFCRHATGQLVRGEGLRSAKSAVLRRAFGTSSPAEEEQQLLKDLVERCGGLPMALELAGKQLALLKDNEWHEFFRAPADFLQGAYNELFLRLAPCWDALTPDRKAVLLDIACLLQARSWLVVKCSCSAGVLADLQKLGLVRECSVSSDCGRQQQQGVEVHPAVADFCKMHIQDGQAAKRYLDLIVSGRCGEPASFPPNRLDDIKVSCHVWHGCDLRMHQVSIDAACRAGQGPRRAVAARLPGRHRLV
jgi:hypothetical protein